MQKSWRQKGVTLLEIMLVLVIGSAIMLLAFRQYQQYEFDQNIQRIKYNVDQLFSAGNSYYQAYCSGFSVSNTNPISVSISSLQNQNFLTAWQPINPLVDTSGNQSYVLQFNFQQPAVSPVEGNGTLSRYITACTNYGTTSASLSCSTPQPIQSGTFQVYVWYELVAVKIANATPARMTSYQNLLAANCISDVSGGSIAPCGSNPTTGSYLVWESLPSSSANTTSSSWQTLQTLSQFNTQYTHDQMYEFNNPTYGNSQNYLCNGAPGGGAQ